jgi:integral membrane protein
MADTITHRSVANLRLIGIAEGISFLLLLGVAMPLKYIAGMPMAVRVMGSLHGLLFVLFLIALSYAGSKRDWAPQTSLSFLVASVLPFGFLMVDGRLKREMLAP